MVDWLGYGLSASMAMMSLPSGGFGCRGGRHFLFSSCREYEDKENEKNKGDTRSTRTMALQLKAGERSYWTARVGRVSVFSIV